MLLLQLPGPAERRAIAQNRSEAPGLSGISGGDNGRQFEGCAVVGLVLIAVSYPVYRFVVVRFWLADADSEGSRS
jgi:hypothetical protein